MKAVEFMVKRLLPPNLREMVTDLDDRTLNTVLAELYKQDPDNYKAITHKLATLGREASYHQGETISMQDLEPVADRDKILSQMDNEISILKKEFRNDPETFKNKREEVWLKYSDLLQKATISGARQKLNNIGMSVFSGARGKPAQIQAMLTTPALYQDQDDKTIPVFIRHSFSEGLRPGEYIAGTYGARKSIIATKTSTAKGGDLAKLMAQASSNLVVTENDCKVDNGVAYDIEDTTAKNRILQRPAGSLPAGTLLDRHALAQLKKEKVNRVVARSPLTCKADGLCAKCVGVTFENRFPKVGEHVGITAANALCLHGSTKVLLADQNWVTIRNIKPGDKVLGFNKDGSFSPAGVVDVIRNGKQPMFEFRFKSRAGALKLVCTHEHKFLAVRYDKLNKTFSEPFEIPIGQLQERGKARYRTGLYIPDGIYSPADTYKEPLAFAIGLIIGDGSICSDSVRLSCYDPSLTDDMHDYLKVHKIGLNGGNEQKKGNFILSTYPDKNPLKERLQDLGLWGHRTRTKHIPSEVWEKWDNESVCALLAGLYAADGYIGSNQEVIKFTSASEELAENVTHLLKHRLLIPGVYMTPFQRGVEWEYDVRVRNKSGMYKLARMLFPYMLGKKKHALSQAMKVHQKFRQDVMYLTKATVKGAYRAYDLVLDNETHMFLAEGFTVAHNSEPITQMSLNTKHTAGQAKGKNKYGGFDILSQFVQSPSEYLHRAQVAPEDGTVTSVEEAPQGGFIVKVNDRDIYVPTGYPVTVKPGDNVEAGDQLSEGIVDVRDVVNLKGLGAGRKYYSERLKEIYDESGLPGHKKNLEILARGALATVTLEDEMDDMEYLPDDVAYYNQIAKKWRPKNVTKLNTSHNPSGWLTRDTLHHTAGTRVTRSLLKELQGEGIEEVDITDAQPPFVPRMDRLRVTSHANRDWLASMSTSYLKDQLHEAAVRGFDTNVKENQHWAPRLAVGDKFGDNIRETGKF